MRREKEKARPHSIFFFFFKKRINLLSSKENDAFNSKEHWNRGQIREQLSRVERNENKKVSEAKGKSLCSVNEKSWY